MLRKRSKKLSSEDLFFVQDDEEASPAKPFKMRTEVCNDQYMSYNINVNGNGYANEMNKKRQSGKWIITIGKLIIFSVILGGCIFFYVSQGGNMGFIRATPEFLYTQRDFHLAALEGSIPILEEVILHKPDWVHHRNRKGLQALHEAVSGGNLDSVSLLIDKGGADVNSRTDYGDGGSVLWWAAQSGVDEDDPVYKYLVNMGAMLIEPLHAPDSDKKGAKIDLVPEDTEKNGFDIDNTITGIINDENQSETFFEKLEFTFEDLRNVAINGDEEMLKKYISERPSWVNKRDENGWLILHEAARAGQASSIEIILTTEAWDKNLLNSRVGKDGEGGNALWLAKHNFKGDHPVVMILENNGCIELGPGDGLSVEVDFTPHDIQIAAARGDVEMLKKYISQRPSWVNKRDENGWLPFHEAAKAGQINSLHILLETSAFEKENINTRTGRTRDGGNALWWATQSNRNDHPVIQFLIDIGCVEMAPLKIDL